MSLVLAKVLEAERLLAANKVDAAAAVLLPVAQKNPKDPNAASLTSIILFRQRKYAQSLFFAERAALLMPNDSGYQANLGLILAANQRPAQANAAYERAYALNPNNSEALLSLANNALNDNNPSKAAEYCKRILDIRWDMQVCPTYVAALASMGRVDEAVEFARAAIEQFPEDSLLMSGRACNLNYVWGAKPSEVARAHRQFGDTLLKHRPHEKFTYADAPTSQRPLRIGLVSCDLRAHSVSFFIEPILRYTPKDQAVFYAYSTNRHEDAVSARLKALCHAWHNCGDLIDIEISRKVEADGIDMLIDLGGLTLNNAMTIFAYKPAPIQLTYCGYPNTTGLSSVDFRIVDDNTDPSADSPASIAAHAAGQPDFDERCTERLIRLPGCFLCYNPPADAPTPKRNSAEFPNITFGSFNANKKINSPVLDLWARLLREVPNSRLLLKAFEYKDIHPRQRIIDAFTSRGIESNRIDIMGPTSGIAEHLAVYERMDVALDTLPYNGTTTTCEALWMGVPVVTMAGDTHASRVGVSLLHTVGTTELIATSPQDYVDRAAALATDPQRLDHYRNNLRSMISRSPLGDGPAFAAKFIAALRNIT